MTSAPDVGAESLGRGPARWAMRRRRRRRTALAAGALALSAAVGTGVWALADTGSHTTVGSQRTPRSDPPSSKAAPPRSTTGGSAPSSTASLPPSTNLRPPGDPITIAFAGDNNGEALPAVDMANAMAGRLAAMKDLLSSADLTVANLETSITQRGTAAPKQFTFRAPPSILEGMQAVGVDVVSMANNHGLDFGPEGLQDSLAAKQIAPIPVVGIGANDDEAFAPAKVTVKGQRVSIIGATQVLDSSLITLWTATADHPGMASAKRVDRLTAEVRKARADSDTVIVFLHWGVEKSTCPSPSQQQLAKTLADAGADLIIGGHAHRVQSGGYLGRAFVDYGLGNFGFRASSPDAAHTGVLTLTVQGRDVLAYRWQPGIIRNATPYPLAGAEAQQALDTWNSLRSCTGLSATPP